MARITFITRNFPPLTGGMERLAHQLYRKLADRHELALVGPAGAENFIESGSDVRTSMISPTPLFLLLSFFKGLFLHVSRRPDLIIGGSGLVGPVVILLAKISGAKSILLVHGLDIVADSRLYQWFFVPFLKRADLVVCNSRNTARLVTESGVDDDNIEIINPGVDIKGGSISHVDAKQTLKLDEKTVLLSIGRLIPRKGLALFVANSLTQLAADDPNIVLLIAGSEPSSALNRSGHSVLKEIQEAVEKHELGAQVQLLGHVDEDVIPALYAAADVFVFPLVETRGDVEGFGMVAVEAAAHGTPTVAFNCGGVADAVSDGESGYLVRAGDYAEFSAAVSRAARGELRDSSKEFASRFSWDNYGARANACIEKALNR